MANLDWGTKHTCQGCGAKYYDLNRSPVVCPKCGAAYSPDTPLRSRRSRPSSPAKVAAPVPAPAPAPSPDGGDADAKAVEADPKVVEEKVVEEDKDEIAALAKAGDEDKLIEDTSDLGEDDDDVAEVVVSSDDDDKEDT